MAIPTSSLEVHQEELAVSLRVNGCYLWEKRSPSSESQLHFDPFLQLLLTHCHFRAGEKSWCWSLLPSHLPHSAQQTWFLSLSALPTSSLLAHLKEWAIYLPITWFCSLVLQFTFWWQQFPPLSNFSVLLLHYLHHASESLWCSVTIQHTLKHYHLFLFPSNVVTISMFLIVQHQISISNSKMKVKQLMCLSFLIVF